MAAVLEQLDAVPGFSVPVHRALTEHIMLGGAPRSIAIMNGTLAGAVGLHRAFQLLDQRGLRVDFLPRDGILLPQRLVALQRDARGGQLCLVARALALRLHQRLLVGPRVDARQHLVGPAFDDGVGNAR